MSDEDEITIAELYPDLSPEERTEAEYNLQRYVEVVGRIFKKLEKRRQAK